MRKLITLGAAGIVAGLVPVGVALAATTPTPHHAAAQHMTATAPVASAPTTTAVAPTPPATTAPAQPSAPSAPVQSPAPVTTSAPAVPSAPAAVAPSAAPAPAPVTTPQASSGPTETHPWVWKTGPVAGGGTPGGVQPLGASTTTTSTAYVVVYHLSGPAIAGGSARDTYEGALSEATALYAFLSAHLGQTTPSRPGAVIQSVTPVTPVTSTATVGVGQRG